MSLELTKSEKASILASIETMLQEVAADGGAGSDRIYLSAQSLDMAGVWDQIAADELAYVISAAPFEARKVFLEGLPHRYAADVSLAILTQAPENAWIKPLFEKRGPDETIERNARGRASLHVERDPARQTSAYVNPMRRSEREAE
ncbi:hypothetical protein [Rhizobium sp. RU36D]|uniref:hypothetical protein n=1 Tax=Rhizobium sp. RU36D TaxID=1907415 RepID=UPI001179F1C3|nr:hypothetical protein [Rhizobium sp. RU36D]